jgi:TRAP-type C4-dicarboxylate transport system substrate-binding protein
MEEYVIMKILHNRSPRLVIFITVIAVLVSALLASCSAPGNSTANKPVVLNLAHFFPPSHPAEKELVKEWAAEIERVTDGMVKIESYPNETLAKADTIYNSVLTGVADLGLSCFSYTRGRFPVLEIFELPGIIYENSKSASMTAWEGIKELDPEEVKDTKLMMVFATGSGDLFTKKPVKKLEDLKGMTIRATGLSAETIAALGGTPSSMSQAEAYDALSKNLVNGNLGPIEILQGWNQAEVTNYITKTPFLYNTLFYITMNLDKWNSLPSDIQEKILTVNERFQAEVAAGLWDKQNEAALNWAVNEKGMEVITLSDEETLRWIKQVEPLQQEKISKNDLLDEEILELVKQLADKYNNMY